MKESIYPPAEDSYLLNRVLEQELPHLLKENPCLKFLEIGCGSGIQLQKAFSLGVKKENILAADINPEAVLHCRALGFRCVLSDLFENVEGRFDLIVFNPPYLPDDKREPLFSKLATTGGTLGGEVITKFLAQARAHLNSGGKIFLISSTLTRGITWGEWKKEKLLELNLFFEKLIAWKLEL